MSADCAPDFCAGVHVRAPDTFFGFSADAAALPGTDDGPAVVAVLNALGARVYKSCAGGVSLVVLGDRAITERWHLSARAAEGKRLVDGSWVAAMRSAAAAGDAHALQRLFAAAAAGPMGVVQSFSAPRAAEPCPTETRRPKKRSSMDAVGSGGGGDGGMRGRIGGSGEGCGGIAGGGGRRGGGGVPGGGGAGGDGGMRNRIGGGAGGGGAWRGGGSSPAAVAPPLSYRGPPYVRDTLMHFLYGPPMGQLCKPVCIS